MPKWKDQLRRRAPIVPMSLNADDSNGYGINHPFYLDTGPMFGVYAGVLPADDELMRDVRRLPPRRLASAGGVRPILVG